MFGIEALCQRPVARGASCPPHGEARLRDGPRHTARARQVVPAPMPPRVAGALLLRAPPLGDLLRSAFSSARRSSSERTSPSLLSRLPRGPRSIGDAVKASYVPGRVAASCDRAAALAAIHYGRRHACSAPAIWPGSWMSGSSMAIASSDPRRSRLARRSAAAYSDRLSAAPTCGRVHDRGRQATRCYVEIATTGEWVKCTP